MRTLRVRYLTLVGVAALTASTLFPGCSCNNREVKDPNAPTPQSTVVVANPPPAPSPAPAAPAQAPPQVNVNH